MDCGPISVSPIDLDTNSMGFDLKTISEEKPKKNKKKRLDTAYPKLQVTPLIEIYSVSIHSNQKLKDGEKCEIYGRIRVVNKLGDDFDLFLRDKDEPECIDLDNTLLLSSPLLDSNGCVNVIIPSEYVSVDVLLFDKAHNDVLIARGDFTLDRTLIDCKGEQVCKHVPGNGGFEARVHYAIFPFAVVATVSVLFFNKEDEFDILNEDVKVPYQVGGEGGGDGGDDAGCEEGDGGGGGESDDDFEYASWDEDDYIDYDNRETESSGADVFGTVIAHSDICSTERNDYYNSSVLFKTLLDQSVKVDSKGFIKLSRSNVAVPAYSSLKIEVDLSDLDTKLPIGRRTVEFKPQDSYIYKKDIVGENGRIRLRVQWNDAYEQLYRGSNLKRSSENAKKSQIEIGSAEEQKRPKVLLVQQSPVSVIPNGILPSAISKKVSLQIPMVEVFSVAVCGKNFEPFDFYGNICVSSSNFVIFSRDASCPQHCPALGAHLIIGSSCCFDVLDDFAIWVGLKDANNRSVISNGHLIWRAYPFYEHKKWIDRRLCSIIRGDRGFAAVHYAIFSDALAAEVNVSLYGNTASSRVSGKLVAEYDTHDYSRSYDREYYRSILFHKDAEEELEICDSVLPLLKSVVAMPRNSPLVFYADLVISPDHLDCSKLPQETKPLKGSLKFKFSAVGESSAQRIGQDVFIMVTVNSRGYEPIKFS